MPLDLVRPVRKLHSPPTLRDVHLAAPMGGLNTVMAGAEMPASDSISQFNLIADALGLRVRGGWREWVTGLDGDARTTLSFKGSARSGNQDRLFQTTSTGIWGCSASTQTPTRVFTFATATADSGYGIAYQMETPAGQKFLLYCDEQNGYHVYRQDADSWAQVVSSTQPAWAPATGYVPGNLVTNGGNVYLCVTGGTSANPGPSGTGNGIADGGGVVWNFNWSVSGVDPTSLVHVMVWKNRAWFTQRDTGQAWFLGTGAVQGAFIGFNFGSQFRQGGCLAGLWNWTVDGGAGIDNYLIAISTAGDVAIYQGTDPTVAGAFGLRGVWFVGGVPSGRSFATEFGGDFLVISENGLVPASKLTIGKYVFDRSQYDTGKVANVFSQYVQQFGTNRGWWVKMHPTENAVVVNVPNAPGQTQPSLQLVMGVARRGWCIYPDVPMWSGEAWNGQFYFGTNDGRVLQTFGFVDGILLSNPNASNPIQWSLLTAFQNLGNARKKQVHNVRPLINSQTGQVNYQAETRFDYDLSPQAPVAGGALVSGNVWDSALWDSGTWSGDFVETQQIFGGVGLGANVAIACRGTANSKTILIGFDIAYDEGGFF